MRVASVRPAIAGFLAFSGCLAPSLHAETPVETLKQLRELEGDVEDVAEKALPATVSLFSERSESSGSGVIISRDGLILTAGHVVEGLEEITVVFPDGKQARADVLGANLSKDCAMAKLQTAGPWAFVELGDSKAVEVGDFVVSLGHAGGYDPLRTPPVRFGRVVGMNPLGFIGTDCTLIGGDSGGPLFDLEGKLIAIHSSIGASLMANNHTGVNNFKSDWARLEKGETWGKLTMNPLKNPDRPVIGFDVSGAAAGGVKLGKVFDDSPAALIGMKTGDILKTIDGEKIGSLRKLQRILAEKEPGDQITLTFSHRGEDRTRKLKLARLADVVPNQE